MSNPARAVADALREAPGAAGLIARWEAARTIGRVLSPVLQAVAPGISLTAPGRCELRDGIVWIAVESAAESAKLRQAAPRLLAALNANGLQVYEIKTRVQAGGMTYPGQGSAQPSSPGIPFAPVTDLGVGAVEKAARELPESRLRNALNRLATTLSRRRATPPDQAG